MSLKESHTAKLSRFLPDGTEAYVADLIIKHHALFRISPKRKTKLGDYRIPTRKHPHRISVNGDLNHYAFLITTIHEFAHLVAFQKYGLGIKPHGKEWQAVFSELFEPIFDLGILPEDVRLALTKYLKKAKASSCSDDALYRVLRRYDLHQSTLVEHLSLGDQFMLNNLVFEKGKKLRKYYLCRNIANNRQYRVLGIAEIQKRINEQA